MRKEMIQQMYEFFVNNNSLSEEADMIFNRITDRVEQISNIDEAELVGVDLSRLMHEAFTLGANAVLDFISEKGVA